MALLSNNLYMGEIGEKVKIIRDPGRDQETIILEFDMSSSRLRLSRYITQLEVSVSLTDAERARAIFWLGYFYAHSVRPLPHRDPQEKEGM